MKDWLQACDEVWLAQDLFKNAKRNRLFSALCFACGWLPEDQKPSLLGYAEIDDSVFPFFTVDMTSCFLMGTGHNNSKHRCR